MSRIRNILSISIMIIASSAVGLLLFEVFLVYENKSKPIEIMPIEINGYEYPFIKSSSTLSPLQIKYDESELLILGDSFTAGIACTSDKENYPSFLSQKFMGETNVVNLGIGGMNNADYVDFLDYFSISRGDIALITLYDNDVQISERNCAQIRHQALNYDIYVPKICNESELFIDKSNENFFQKINNKLRGYKTVQLVKEALVQIPAFSKHFHRTDYRKIWNDFESDENKWMRSSLRVMRDQMTKQGGSAIFTYYPNTNRISIDDERHEIWKTFIEFVKQNDGISILNPYPYFIKNSNEKSMVWSLTDKHPNCAAHELMAEFIFNKLIIKNE